MSLRARRTDPKIAAAAASRGFTIIEVMIVVLIAGVLAALAYPSLIDAIRKSRRADAFTALAKLQQAQERWRTNNANYTLTLSNLNVASATTPSGYYTLSMGAPASGLATGYIVTAQAISGTSQANDAQCSKLSVQVVGGDIKYAGCGSCSTFTYVASNACWAR